MSNGGRASLESYLRDRGVKVQLLEHAHIESAAAEARAAQLPAEQTAKTVLLHSPAGYRFAVIPASDMLDLNKAAAALDVRRSQLRLATEAEMAADFPAYEVGAVPPLGPPSWSTRACSLTRTCCALRATTSTPCCSTPPTSCA